MNDLADRTEVVVACSFCSKPSASVATLVAGQDGVYICNECVAACKDELFECSFCYREFRRKDILMSNQYGQHICKKCVKICTRIEKHKNVHQKSVGSQTHE